MVKTLVDDKKLWNKITVEKVEDRKEFACGLDFWGLCILDAGGFYTGGGYGGGAGFAIVGNPSEVNCSGC